MTRTAAAAVSMLARRRRLARLRAASLFGGPPRPGAPSSSIGPYPAPGRTAARATEARPAVPARRSSGDPPPTRAEPTDAPPAEAEPTDARPAPPEARPPPEAGPMEADPADAEPTDAEPEGRPLAGCR